MIGRLIKPLLQKFGGNKPSVLSALIAAAIAGLLAAAFTYRTLRS
jgi:hypothetical protein